MNKIIHAKQLVEYIENDIKLEIVPSNNCPYSHHIGALFVDIILQAGVNYKYIVAPRVNKLYINHPEVDTVQKFRRLIDMSDLATLINWKNEVKLKRIFRLMDFCDSNNIDSACDLRTYLRNSIHKEAFLQIEGIGKKTHDYLLKLMNVDTIAVDRHIFAFLEKAGIETLDYDYSKCVVEFAADFMNISRRSIDYSIWRYMAYNQKRNIIQDQLQFDM